MRRSLGGGGALFASVKATKQRRKTTPEKRKKILNCRYECNRRRRVKIHLGESPEAYGLNRPPRGKNRTWYSLAEEEREKET